MHGVGKADSIPNVGSCAAGGRLLHWPPALPAVRSGLAPGRSRVTHTLTLGTLVTLNLLCGLAVQGLVIQASLANDPSTMVRQARKLWPLLQDGLRTRSER